MKIKRHMILAALLAAGITAQAGTSQTLNPRYQADGLSASNQRITDALALVRWFESTAKASALNSTAATVSRWKQAADEERAYVAMMQRPTAANIEAVEVAISREIREANFSPRHSPCDPLHPSDQLETDLAEAKAALASRK